MNLRPFRMPAFQCLNGRKKSLHISRRRRSSFRMRRKSKSSKTAVGFLAGLRDWLSSHKLVFGSGCRRLVFCLGVGFLAMNYLWRRRANAQYPTSQSVPPVRFRQSKQFGIIASCFKKPEVSLTTASATVSQAKGSRAIRALAIRHGQKIERQMTADNQSTPINDASQKLRKAPVLSSYEDNDDKSLRLADLFDEVGGYTTINRGQDS